MADSTKINIIYDYLKSAFPDCTIQYKEIDLPATGIVFRIAAEDFIKSIDFSRKFLDDRDPPNIIGYLYWNDVAGYLKKSHQTMSIH